MPESEGLFSRVGVVLLRPRSPGNVGSVARAMKNMGFSRLVIADPVIYDDERYFDDEARRMAWNAADLLDSRHIAPDLDAALAPFTFVVGTSSRPAPPARVAGPRDAAAAIAGHLAATRSGAVALLLGQEDIGLTRDDQSRCHLIASIPSSDLYPSLNLSHAALLFLYELRLALCDSGTSALPRADRPTAAQIDAFHRRLEEALDALDFFQGTGKAHMMREMSALFNRAALTQRELAIFEGLVNRILWTTGRSRRASSGRGNGIIRC